MRKFLEITKVFFQLKWKEIKNYYLEILEVIACILIPFIIGFIIREFFNFAPYDTEIVPILLEHAVSWTFGLIFLFY